MGRRLRAKQSMTFSVSVKHKKDKNFFLYIDLTYSTYLTYITEEIKSVMNNDDLNFSPGLQLQLTGSGTTGWPSDVVVLQYAAISLDPSEIKWRYEIYLDH